MNVNTHTQKQLTLQELRMSLKAVFIDRDEIIDGLLAALVSRQHILLLGPPGTAKSLLVQTLCKALLGANYFSWLLTRFTTPEELYGPISLKGLKNDQYTRKMQGKLPEAHIAFLDECFKANSGILNSLLTLINERLVYDDGVATPCPLLSVVGASNELPEGEELEALYDRFALRFWVEYIKDKNLFEKLITSPKPEIEGVLPMAELEKLQQEAANIPLADGVVGLIITIKLRLEKEGIVASDRRWIQILEVLKGYALVQGDSEVTEDLFDLLPAMLWREPNQRDTIASVIATVGNPLAIRVIEIVDAATQVQRPIVNDPNYKTDANWSVLSKKGKAELLSFKTELEGLKAQANGKRISAARKIEEGINQVDALIKQLDMATKEHYGW